MLEGLAAEIEEADPGLYRSDWWALALSAERRGAPRPAPRAALRPKTTGEVSLILKWAAERGIPVVPWGGGSGVCGAAEPGEAAVVVDMTAMNQIAAMDKESLTVTSETGILGPALEAALAKDSMTLGHVPQSFPISTLGGWISTKATGQLSTRYGGIEQMLLGLTAVTSDGAVLSSRRSPRYSSGPDWWRSFVGAEGTLGIVTEATLAAHPIPESWRWVGFVSPTFRGGLSILRRVVQGGLRPGVARLYDEADAALNFGPLSLPPGCPAIVRFEGHPRMVEAEAEVFDDLVRSAGAVAIGPEGGEHWWERRFSAIDGYRRILSRDGPFGPAGMVDTMEVSTMWSGLGPLYDSVKAALATVADAVLAHASHLYGSGANIYFTFFISSARNAEEAERRYGDLWKRGMEATLAAGGSISHHHGIGLLKAPWMHEELGSGFEGLKRLKRAFDPAGISNPGKLGL